MIKNLSLPRWLFGLALTSFPAGAALGATSPVLLPGTTQHDAWVNFNSTTMPGYGTFPGASPWSSGAIGSNAAGSADAALARISGSGGSGPFVASASIYFFGAGTLSVIDATPVANLQTVIFQIDFGPGTGNGFTAEPTLSYNSGVSGPAPQKHLLGGGVGADDPDGNPAGTSLLLYQWDLTGITDITSYAVQWSNTQHSQLYAVQLDQSSTFAAVPEPALLSPLMMGVMTLLRRRRRTL